MVIDYKKQDFETILKDYDVVLNSQYTKTFEKSLRILNPVEKSFPFQARLILPLNSKSKRIGF